jgi:hypothetical protein
MKTVIEMAKEADIDAEAEGLTQALERFAALVRAERKWVDLTDDEMWDVFISKDWTGEPLQLMSAVIAAFKEKNK